MRGESGNAREDLVNNLKSEKSISYILSERRMKMKKYMLLVAFVSLFLVISCAPRSHFGVTDKAIGVPPWFDETETAIMQAEKSPGAKYCPEKIAQAKELAEKRC